MLRSGGSSETSLGDAAVEGNRCGAKNVMHLGWFQSAAESISGRRVLLNEESERLGRVTIIQRSGKLVGYLELYHGEWVWSKEPLEQRHGMEVPSEFSFDAVPEPPSLSGEVGSELESASMPLLARDEVHELLREVEQRHVEQAMRLEAIFARYSGVKYERIEDRKEFARKASRAVQLVRARFCCPKCSKPSTNLAVTAKGYYRFDHQALGKKTSCGSGTGAEIPQLGLTNPERNLNRK